jgi:hypothetical protein
MAVIERRYNRKAFSGTAMSGLRVLVFALVASAAPAQFRIAPEHTQRLDIALNEAVAKQTLPCEAEPSKTFLDFAFRFEVGYLVHCPLKEFGGIETSIAAYTRVQPANAPPVWFSEWYRVPGIPDDLRSRINLQRNHDDIEFSGVLGAGEGDYIFDLVVVDRQHRFYHRNWKTRVTPHGSDARAPISLQPNTVAPLGVVQWPQGASDRNLNRLAVLVDAAPVHAGSTKLHAWDRGFLVEALSSVLTQLPSNSVRVTAFNLDQRAQFFEADEFTPDQAKRFSHALEGLELGKVSYDVLQRSDSACEMLVQMFDRERESERPADAIVIVGPANRLTDKVPSERTAERRVAGPPIFYLKYVPNTPVRLHSPFAGIRGLRDDPAMELPDLEPGGSGEFADIVQHAAALNDGMTINVHSPAELADALRRIQHRLRPATSVPTADLHR